MKQKQPDTIQELKDRLNAVEAICMDYLIRICNSEAQAKVKFDDYRISYTQEAIEQRKVEDRAKQLKENYKIAQADFNDLAKASYWSLVFMTKKEQEKELDKIWLSLIYGVELPEGAKRPQHAVPEITVDELISRRSELNASIDRANPTQDKSTIEHCTKAKKEFPKRMERERDRLINGLKHKDELSEHERKLQIISTENDINYRIKRHVNTMDRQIQSAERRLANLEKHKDELTKVNKLLGKLLNK